MVLELNFDGKKYKINNLEGNLKINSNPFFINYSINKVLDKKISPFEKITGMEEYQYSSYSKKSLNEIDGLLFQQKEMIKIEIIKGKVFIMDKSLEDCLNN
jgi:hypothetical protein